MIVDTIARAINPNYHLERRERNWLLGDDAHRVELRVPTRHSFGFSLDHPERSPLAFFSASPPRDLAKVCDGMVAFTREGRLYLFSIEMKSSHKEDASKQLVNGQLFWRWLVSLCVRHGHIPEATDICYISVIVWRPMEGSTRLGFTQDSGPGALLEWPGGDGFDARYEVRNRKVVPLAEFVRRRRPQGRGQGPGG